ELIAQHLALRSSSNRLTAINQNHIITLCRNRRLKRLRSRAKLTRFRNHLDSSLHSKPTSLMFQREPWPPLVPINLPPLPPVHPDRTSSPQERLKANLP